MADEEDGGIDKQNVLSEIDGVPAPAPPPAAPAALRVPAPEPAPIQASPVRVGGAPRRHKWAAIVASVVALIWLAVGLAVRAWTPSLIGVAFGVAAATVWAVEVWDGD